MARSWGNPAREMAQRPMIVGERRIGLHGVPESLNVANGVVRGGSMLRSMPAINPCMFVPRYDTRSEIRENSSCS